MQLKVFKFKPVDRQGGWLEKLNSEIRGAVQVEFVLVDAGSCCSGGEKTLIIYVLTAWEMI